MSSTLIVPTGAPITPDLSNVSMADYRASREKPAEAAAADDPAVPVAGAVQPLGDTTDPNQEAAAAAAGDDDDDLDDAPGATEAEKARSKSKGGWQRKIQKLTSQVETLTQQLAGKPAAAAAGGEGADAEAAAAAAAAEPKFDKPEPKIEDFETLTDFTRAHTEWVLDGRDFARGVADARVAFDKQMTELADGWKTRKTEALTRLSDYAAVTAAVDDVQLSKPHQMLFLESPFGPDLAYQLAKDRPALEKFAALSPAAAAKEFGRLEGKFEAAQAAAPQTPIKKVSSAPAPIKPLAGGSTPGAGNVEIKNISLADYRRMREAKRIK